MHGTGASTREEGIFLHESPIVLNFQHRVFRDHFRKVGLKTAYRAGTKAIELPLGEKIFPAPWDDSCSS